MTTTTEMLQEVFSKDIYATDNRRLKMAYKEVK